jgi:hypothetical protein
MRRFRLLTAGLACVCTMVWAIPITIGNSTQDLAFGRLAAGAGGGTITIHAASGVRSSGGSVVLVPSGSASVARFSVSGDANATYAITLPSNGEVFLTSGANSMAVNGFTSHPAASGQLNLSGTQVVQVGATLSVGSSQTVGAYSGNFIVRVEYN